MRIYLYINHQFPDATLVSWRALSTPLACASYTAQENRELRSLMRSLLGHSATGRCSLSHHVRPEDVSFALAVAMQVASIDLPISVLVVGKADLDGTLTFNTPPYQFGHVARRYRCSLILMPMNAKGSFNEIRHAGTVLDAVRHILSYKPDLKGNRYPLSRIQGLETAKRAMLISLAGRLHLLFIGPPGCGKTFLLSEASSFVQDAADFWVRSSMSASYLMEHHIYSLVAGGRLILDELPNLQRSVLESVRTEMDDNGELLVQAAMNPCPCAAGNEGTCTCSERERQQYWNRIGLPLLDRFDIKLRIEPVVDWSTHINAQVSDWEKRMERCLRHRPTHAMCSQTVLKASRSLNLEQLTARGRFSLAKIALTIAEWDGKMEVDQAAFREAMNYRQFSREEH